MRQFQNEADYIARQAKKGRRQKRIRMFNERDDAGGSLGKGGGRKRSGASSFEDGLVNTSAKSVKRLRHVANKKIVDERRAARKKGKNVGKGRGKSKSSFA